MLLLTLALACKDPAPTPESPGPDSPEETATTDSAAADQVSLRVRVTLDDAPVAGATVLQGGGTTRVVTDDAGEAVLVFDRTIEGDRMIIATHPEARTDGVLLPRDLQRQVDEQPWAIDLVRFDPRDNVIYEFQDPGAPDRRETTGQCAHCHISIVEAWHASPHRSSASNPVVQDVYAGAAAALTDAEACADAGGRWLQGRAPGTGEPAARCYLGDGVLPDLNPGCGESEACDNTATAFGACADCHAPGINGALGGRDLLDATGHAFDSGVHCDVCHRVEAVVPDAPAGVAGRLHLVRPTEITDGPLGPWLPLTFGPYGDTPNPRMGAVGRDHFREATFCAGCHQLDQPALLPGAALDPQRWPEGTLPVHSTWAEWQASAFAPDTPCQSCHMPADASAGNSADLGHPLSTDQPGLAGGWWRTPGEVRRHAWYGPRQRDSRMLELAATLSLEVTPAEAGVDVAVTTRNVGPAHALPTGEPLRHLLMVVEATCDGEPLAPTGGAVVPDYGGVLAQQDGTADLGRWPQAREGDRVVVLARQGWVDYAGFGPFGDGRFDAAAKGIPSDSLVGSARVTAVDGQGRVTLDAALPAGDIALLVRDGWPADGGATQPLAGRPGWGFARVMVGPDGERMAPHHRAVDVASDNRLLPGAAWTSAHRFAPCDGAVEARAALVYRPWPASQGEPRGWALEDAVIAEVRR